MPGLTDWFDVFRCGTHTDRFGREVTVTRGDIDRAIQNYQKDSAPIVVGHPALNAPAYGWIGAFRRVGDVVQAKASSVADEFADLVKRHLYKNRSLALGPGLRFRHVGFLGAQPPAVKGLKDIQFSDEEDYMSVEFSESANTPAAEAEVPSSPAAEPDRTAAAAEPNAEAAQSGQAEKAEAEAEEPRDQSAGSDEASAMRAKLKAAEAEASAAKEAAAKLQNEIAKLKGEKRRAEFAAFTGDLIKTGQLPQAQRQSVCEFMECLDGAGTYEFSEGSESVLERFKGLLKTLLKPVEFAEMATAAAAAPAADNPQQIAAGIRQYRQEEASHGRRVNASQAMAHILGGKHE